MNELDCSIDKMHTTFDITSVLEKYKYELKTRTYHHLGYPYNLDYDYKVLHGLVNYSINNLGDPFIPSNYGVHSRPFEVAVIKWFADLWKLNEYWGYVTACGTEGNLHGIWLGRENMAANQQNDDKVVLLGSTACHYSVWKAARMYCMEALRVATDDNDEVNYDILYENLLKLKERNRYVVMIVNIGSTVKGAVDDLVRVTDAFSRAGYTPQHDYYIHVDGALFGMMAPFLPDTSIASKTLTFENEAICSISVSGHKFIGTSMPCGVVLTRKRHVETIVEDIAYIGSRDATVLGSRNGHAPLFLWYAIAKKGLSGFRSDVEKCMANAKYMYEKLKALKIHNLLLNELSSTVVFKKPNHQEFITKWQLACDGDIAHVVVMPNVCKDKIDEFIAELILHQDE